MKYALIASLLSVAVYAAPAPGNRQPQQAQTGQTGQTAGTAAPQGNLNPAQAAKIAAGGGLTQAGSPQAVAALTKLQVSQGAAPGAPIAGQTPTSVDLATAAINWKADTSMVSNFLDVGKSITNDTAFKLAAGVAYNAEVDELNHKAVIDAANSQMPSIIGANSTLATGGAFQQVVDLLLEMNQKGRAAVGDIDLIVQNRCVNVLPNIDAYMASVDPTIQSVRPKACNQNGVTNGVQGQGATQQGQAPGTPAAAIAAAQALAAGTGNGMVNNAAFPVAGASSTAPAAGAKTGAQPNAQQAGGAKAAAPNAQQAGGAKAGAAKAAPAAGATKGKNN